MKTPDGALRLLGLAARAGSVVPGTERVRGAARAGTLHFVFVAGDASENSHDKLIPLLESRGVAFVVAFDRNALGAAVGRSPLSALGITEPQLARRVQELLAGNAGAPD